MDIINQDTVFSLFKKKYRDLYDSTSLENRYSFLAMRDEYKFNIMLDSDNFLSKKKMFNDKFTLENKKNHLSSYIEEMNSIVSQFYYHLHFTSFSKNSFLIKKNLRVNFGRYIDKMFGGSEFIPDLTINLIDSKIRYSLIYEDNYYKLVFDNYSSNEPRYNGLFYEDKDFYSFIIFVTNKICNHLADDIYVNTHLEIGAYGMLTFPREFKPMLGFLRF